jgi:hypothetical protein
MRANRAETPGAVSLDWSRWWQAERQPLSEPAVQDD